MADKTSELQEWQLKIQNRVEKAEARRSKKLRNKKQKKQQIDDELAFLDERIKLAEEAKKAESARLEKQIKA